MEQAEPDPWIPDQPTLRHYTCAHCGAWPCEERICIPCYNALVIALKAEVTSGLLSDWISPRHLHRSMLCVTEDQLGRPVNAAFARHHGAYIGYSTVVHLIIARAKRNGDL